MKDRFEVRAWNNRTKEYVNEKGINTIYKGAYNATMLLGLFQYLKNDKQIQAIAKDFEFEQCTGLKDKNGKLIYEGDIVKLFDNSKDYQIFVDKKTSSFKAKRPYMAGFEVLSFEIYQPDLFTIVGNIHENSKLLED